MIKILLPFRFKNVSSVEDTVGALIDLSQKKVAFNDDIEITLLGVSSIPSEVWFASLVDIREDTSVFSNTITREKVEEYISAVVSKYERDGISLRWLYKVGFLFDCLKSEIGERDYHIVAALKSKPLTVLSRIFLDSLIYCLVRLDDVPVMLI